MRPKFLVGLVLSVMLIFSVVWFLKDLPQRGDARHEAAEASSSVVAGPAALPVQLDLAPTPTNSVAIFPKAPPRVSSLDLPVMVPSLTNAELTMEERAAQLDQLDEWSMNNDPQSLTNIISYLASPDAQVRVAAIEAAKQFGSVDAIPALKAAAASAESIEDKIAYLEAAEFLSLPGMEIKPTTLEEAAQNRARIAAYQQAQKQPNSTVQNQPATPQQSVPNNSQP